MVSAAGQHAYGAENIVTGKRPEVSVARMSPYADKSLTITTELLETFTATHNQGELEMEAIRGVAWSADSADGLVQVKRVRFKD